MCFGILPPRSDLALLDEKYKVIVEQAVDMFPHSYHVECVALLELK